MSIKTEYTCEKCGKKELFDGPMFLAKIPAKESGWKAVKVGERWDHVCGDCGGGK